MKNWEPSKFTMVTATFGMIIGILSLFIRNINEMASYIMIAIGTTLVASVSMTEVIKQSKWAKVEIFKSIREMVNHDFFITGKYTIQLDINTSHNMITRMDTNSIAYAVDSCRGVPIHISACDIFQQLTPGVNTNINNFTLDMIKPGFYTELNVVICSPKYLYKALSIDTSTDGFSNYLTVCIEDNLSSYIFLRKEDGTVCDSFRPVLNNEFFNYMGLICTMKPGEERRTTYGKVVRNE